ncbi:MAG TPA: response regulator [Oligoflexus sp.]|uniref:response regulator n=1 Tax=Oligoflexus sp. TaxID=1971216 RepID=UPI002D5E09FB|nr:response regulator [Oligoflexus sp.]HYX37931.1 response regulator [Oligoflexus sp.]
MAERWLVIDDSSTIQRVIKLAFQGYDVVITEADSCQDAAREIMSQPPSLVIADAALGGVQGVQDFLALKAHAPLAPFIILEGSYDNIDEAQFRAAGFQHFLKKPFDGAQLLSITRQALGRALPYRGEAAVAAAAGAPQPMAQPTMTMPPPPPPLRAARSMSEPGTSFPPESTQTGFDLGLHETRSPQHASEGRAAMAMTQMSAPQADARSMAQTIVSEVRAATQTQLASELRPMQNAAPADRGNFHYAPSSPSMSQSGSFGRKEAPLENVRNPVSFSLEDDEPMTPPATSAPASSRADASGWEGPRPAGSHLGNLLEPMLQEEMEKLVRIAVEDYCRKNFAGIARDLIQRELDRLTQDRSRLLMD